MVHFFNDVFVTKNTDKLVENRTADDGEDVEHIISKVFQRVHVSFQSTSFFNIRTVNTLNNCKTIDMIRARGEFYNKRYWGFEMNEARKLYLGTSSRSDSISHLIKNFCIKYIYWKYWNSPMIRDMSLAVLIACDMYLEAE